MLAGKFEIEKESVYYNIDRNSAEYRKEIFKGSERAIITESMSFVKANSDWRISEKLR